MLVTEYLMYIMWGLTFLITILYPVIRFGILNETFTWERLRTYVGAALWFCIPLDNVGFLIYASRHPVPAASVAIVGFGTLMAVLRGYL